MDAVPGLADAAVADAEPPAADSAVATDSAAAADSADMTDSAAPTDSADTNDSTNASDLAAPEVTQPACSSQKPCPAAGLPCSVAQCQAGSCVTVAAADGSVCEDGNPCTKDSCLQGQCKGAPDAKLCPPANPCLVNNGGCGDPKLITCANQGGKAVCTDIDECKVKNGGCGGKDWYTCKNNVAAPPSCTQVAGFHMPWACGKTVKCSAGNNAGYHHTGLSYYAHDFSMGLGTAITAPRGGKVTAVYLNSKPGDACYTGCPYSVTTQKFKDCCAKCLSKSNNLYLKYADGTVGLFSHIQSAKVKVGDEVAPGQTIATVGTNGCSTGPHLHTMRMVKGSNTKVGQSVLMSYLEAGNPKAGALITSKNCP